MDKLEYQGKTYFRFDSKWTNSKYIVVHEELQKELNESYINSLDLSSYSTSMLIREGDKLKDSTSYSAAIILYERTIKDCDEKTLSYILPKLTSCYRYCFMPRKTINLLSFAKAKFGDQIITPVLLTSVAAAYCDLHEYENALRCCRWAYKKYGGHGDPYLANVFARIKKESGLE